MIRQALRQGAMRLAIAFAVLAVLLVLEAELEAHDEQQYQIQQ